MESPTLIYMRIPEIEAGRFTASHLHNLPVMSMD